MSVLFLVLICVCLAWWVSPRAKARAGRQAFIDGTAHAGVSDGKCVFDQQAFTSSNRVVMYYAPWCTFCTTFRPEFDKAAIQAKMAGLDVCFVTVNAASQPKGSTCIQDKAADVYPTIQLETEEHPDQTHVYNGRRNTADLLSWVNTSLGAGRPL